MSLLEGAFGTNIYGGTFNIHGVASSPASIALKELSSRAAHSAFHDSAARFDKPKCHPNTRKTILDRLERWMRELSDQELSLLWLYGGAGAGKSAIMQSIVERCVHHRVVLGTFFFQRADESRNNAEALFRTLAYQVATAFPSALDVLGPVITNNPLVLKASLETQALKLLVRPLQRLAAIGQLRPEDSIPHVFVIDGLDECQNPEKQAAIIRIIADILHDHRLRVKFIIASRPETAIKQAFLNDPRLERFFDSILLDDDEEAACDIRQYIEDTFVDIVTRHPLRQHIVLPWPEPRDIDRLVWKSSGHFVFASTAMKYIASSKERPPRALKVILGLEKARQGQPFAELDALYTHIIESAAYRAEALSILTESCMPYGFYDSLTVTQACALLDYVPEDIPLFLSDIEAIVSIEGDRIQFRHASLQDFLKDKSRSRHFCPSSDHHVERATRLIQLIQTGVGHFSIDFAERIVLHYFEYLSLVVESPPHKKSFQAQLWKVSARDIYQLVESGRDGTGELHASGPSEYMDLVLHWVERGDSSLYGHHLKIYLELLIDCAHQQTTFGHRPQIMLSIITLIRPLRNLDLVRFWGRELLKGLPDDIIDDYFDHITLGPHSKELLDLTDQTLKDIMCSDKELWQSNVTEAASYILYYIHTDAFPHRNIFSGSAHRRFLMRWKPRKYVSSGRPMITKWIYICDCSRHYTIDGEREKLCIYRRYRKGDFRFAKWNTVTMTDNTTFNKIERAPYPVADEDRYSTSMYGAFDMDRRLRTISTIMPNASYSTELLEIARRLLPSSAFTWYPGPARRARNALDTYVKRCLRHEAALMKAKNESGSVDALVERAQDVLLNDKD